MVDPTHVIVLMVPLGATLDVSRVAEVAVSAGAEIVATRAVPVPIWDVMEPYSEPRLSQDCIACRDTLRGGK